MDIPLWMYALHAFTPFFALSVSASIKRTSQEETENREELKGNAQLIAVLLTALIVAVPFYAAWLGLHWALFKFIDIPFLYDQYFYIPYTIPYLLPYLIGIGFIVCRVKLAESTNKKLTSVISIVVHIFLSVAVYMVLMTYLKWLHLCWNA